MASCFGLDVEVITPAEARGLHPVLNIDDLVGVVHLPMDGQINPADVTQAFAKGARRNGARIFEDTKVTAVETSGGKVSAVQTEQERIETGYVVNCAGMWAREVGKLCGINVPLHAAEHYYVVTESMPEVTGVLPTLRDLDYCNYFKTDAGKLLIGTF